MLLLLSALAAAAAMAVLLAWLVARAARRGGLEAPAELLLASLLLGASWPCGAPLGPALGLLLIHWHGGRLRARGHGDPGAVKGVLALFLLLGSLAYLLAVLVAG